MIFHARWAICAAATFQKTLAHAPVKDELREKTSPGCAQCDAAVFPA